MDDTLFIRNGISSFDNFSDCGYQMSYRMVLRSCSKDTEHVVCNSSAVFLQLCFLICYKYMCSAFLDLFPTLVRACIARLQVVIKLYQEISSKLSVSSENMSDVVILCGNCCKKYRVMSCVH